MSGYDVFMGLVLVGATLFGVWKGMAWQIASLASLIASYFVALAFSPQLAPVFGDEAPWNRFIAMAVLYVVTGIVIWMLFRIVSGAIERVKLKEFDRQIGGVFGLAKGVLLCIAITLFAVSLLPANQRDWVISSKSGGYITQILAASHDVIPAELHDVLHPYIHKAQEKLDPNSPFRADDGYPTAERRVEIAGERLERGLIPTNIPAGIPRIGDSRIGSNRQPPPQPGSISERFGNAVEGTFNDLRTGIQDSVRQEAGRYIEDQTNRLIEQSPLAPVPDNFRQPTTNPPASSSRF